MTFEEYTKTKHSSKGRSRNNNRSSLKILQYKNLNHHLNFEKESSKSNSRKDPTLVCCVSCKKKFILPFKPRHPEVYCDVCFKKKNKVKK